MTSAEIKRLVEDHPKVIYMSFDQMAKRYWMYDGTIVARARMQVYVNRIKAPFITFAAKVNDALVKILGGNA